MDVLLNEKSIKMQFTEETFIEYLIKEALPVMELLTDIDATLLKEYSTYEYKITKDKTIYELINRRGNPVIDRLKDTLVQLTCAPFWNDNIYTRKDVKYTCDIDEIPNCITESFERKGVLYSFINGGYSTLYLEIICDDLKDCVRNFSTLDELKKHMSELGLLTLWEENSFNIESLGLKFEIRFREDNHNMPHFHLSNANESASISIPDADIIAGSLNNSSKAISWSLQNMKNIVDLWNKIHPDKMIKKY